MKVDHKCKGVWRLCNLLDSACVVLRFCLPGVTASPAAAAATADPLIASSAGARHANLEEQRWRSLEDHIKELDRHLVVYRARRHVVCPSCVRDVASGFNGFCLGLPTRLDDCLDAKRRCVEHVNSIRHKQHIESGRRQTQLAFAVVPADGTGAAASSR